MVRPPEGLLGRLAAILALATAFYPACKTVPTPPPPPIPPATSSPTIHAEASHLVLTPRLLDGSLAFHAPAGSRIYLTGELRGFTPSPRDIICLTPYWTVDAIGLPVPGPTQCSQPYLPFTHWYSFTHPGTFGVTLSLHLHSKTRIADKTIYPEIQPAP